MYMSIKLHRMMEMSEKRIAVIAAQLTTSNCTHRASLVAQ